MIDELDLIRAARPDVAEPAPDVLARHRAALVEAARPAETLSLSVWRRRRRWLIPIAAAVALTLAAAAWALTRGPNEVTSVSCGLDNVIGAVSADPVADCAAIWEEIYGEPAPPLVVYDNGSGGIVVVPQDFEPPPGWTRLAEDFTLDDRVVELKQLLDDIGGDLRSQCLSTEDAQPLIDAALATTGLDWETVVLRPADGVTTCAVTEPRNHTVILAAIGRPTYDPDAPFAVFARELNDATTSQCLTLAEAEETARQLAVANGLDVNGGAAGVRIEAFPTPDAACARASTSVSGGIRVVIRGS